MADTDLVIGGDGFGLDKLHGLGAQIWGAVAGLGRRSGKRRIGGAWTLRNEPFAFLVYLGVVAIPGEATGDSFTKVDMSVVPQVINLSKCLWADVTGEPPSTKGVVTNCFVAMPSVFTWTLKLVVTALAVAIELWNIVDAFEGFGAFDKFRKAAHNANNKDETVFEVTLVKGSEEGENEGSSEGVEETSDEGPTML